MRATVCFSWYSDMSRRNQSLLVVEQELGQSASQLGLATPVRARKMKSRPAGLDRTGPAGARTAFATALTGFVLADDPVMKPLLHLDELATSPSISLETGYGSSG